MPQQRSLVGHENMNERANASCLFGQIEPLRNVEPEAGFRSNAKSAASI